MTALGRVALLMVVGARHWVPVLLRVLVRRRPSPTEVGVRLRRTCEELGVTYIKLGQYLATRYDILPIEVCHELDHLFERVEPQPVAVIRDQVAAELGRSVDEVFVEFDPVPIGSASVAQVHRARTWDGRDVAVKVRRPHVVKIFRADSRSLRRLTRVVDLLRRDKELRVTDLADEFATFTARELDFTLERATMTEAAAESDGVIDIPVVHADLCTSGVLTLEFVEGVTLAEVLAVLQADGDEGVARRYPGMDIVDVFTRLALGILHQLFVVGHFQADPHPGNVIVRPDGRVVLIDFGIFGRLTAARMADLASYIESLILGNIAAAVRTYRRLVTYTPRTQVATFRTQLTSLLSGFAEASADPGSSASDRHLGRFSDDLLRLLYRNHVRLDLNTLLFWRTLIVLDATLQSSADFDLQETARRFFATAGPSIAERVLAAATRVETVLDLLAAARDVAAARPGPPRSIGVVRTGASAARAVTATAWALATTVLAVALVLRGWR